MERTTRVHAQKATLVFKVEMNSEIALVIVVAVVVVLVFPRVELEILVRIYVEAT